MSIEVITILMFVSMVLLLLTGLPLVFCLGAIAIAFALLLWGGPGAGGMLAFTTWGLMNWYMMIAIPFFLFMGAVLQVSGIADTLFGTIYKWMGGLRGGLAMGTVMICAIIAAMVGLTGPATVTMGLIALPSMVKRGYNKIMVTGAIQAGGALGFLIPPSILAIVYCLIAHASVGKLFAAGVGPGLMLATFYIIYIGVRCNLQPNLGPTIPLEERASWKDKLISLKWLILPTLLICMVLGFIVLGVTSITEASAIGAFGAILCAAINRRLTLRALREALFTTARITAMVLWVGISAIAFSTIYDGLGAVEIIKGVLAGLGLGPYGVLIMIQLSLIILGMFLDDGAIMFITTPVYVPLIESLGFDPVWFGIVFMVNLQTSFLTPPFGYALFYMKRVVTDIFRSGKISQEITMADIYRSVWPFVLIQVAGLVMVIVFPSIAMWLPSLIFGVSN